jgi:two-component sensor histidine kinase
MVTKLSIELAKKKVIKTEHFQSDRVNEILEVIYSFARLDFTKKVNISDSDDLLDGIGTGVNMLGEELNHSAVSLKEKEQLLKEIHHRVKNNLQIVSSLLNLQSEHVKDAVFLTLIRESKNRINSMALVHEMLYRSRDLNKINLKDYIKRLVTNISVSFDSQEALVQFELNIADDLFFEIDKMIHLGLLINELISNSYKYAFTQSKKGIITINITRIKKQIKLEVMDNGKGFANDFDTAGNNSLGLQLIYMLSEQLEGKAKFSSEKGVKFELVFSI